MLLQPNQSMRPLARGRSSGTLFICAALLSSCGLLRQDVERSPAAVNSGTADLQDYCYEQKTSATRDARCNEEARYTRDPVISLTTKEEEIVADQGSAIYLDLKFIPKEEELTLTAIRADISSLLGRTDRLSEEVSKHLRQYVTVTYQEGAILCFYIHPDTPVGKHSFTIMPIGSENGLDFREIRPSLRLYLQIEKGYGTKPKTLKESCPETSLESQSEANDY